MQMAEGTEGGIGGNVRARGCAGSRPHEVLEAAGFKVLLADARHMAGVAARDKKSDPTDCEWIQRLHSVGMLKGAFRPAEQVCMLRTW